MIGHQLSGVSAVIPGDSVVTRVSQELHTLKLGEILHPTATTCQTLCPLSRQLLMLSYHQPHFVAQYQHLMCSPLAANMMFAGESECLDGIMIRWGVHDEAPKEKHPQSASVHCNGRVRALLNSSNTPIGRLRRPCKLHQFASVNR